MNIEKEALLAITRLKQKVEHLEYASKEPVAIIGMSVKFPGAADIHQYWQLLSQATDPVSYHQEFNTSCGLLESINDFDGDFFNISPREAQKMHPKQKLLLELVWDALENAQYPAAQLDRTELGVWIGASTSGEYFDPASSAVADAYSVTGSLNSIIAGRISYLLGAKGPAVTLDTACSSSLVAIHQAITALRNKECSIAIAGGVGLMPRDTQALNTWHTLGHISSSGRCRTFDAGADGTIFADGCGVVVLKRLSDALRDGDAIAAVIRGSAVNHDGHTQGLTVPSGAAQEAVVRAALKQAGVRPADVGYIECHGTGTRLGDPIEVQALGAVLVEGRDAAQPVILGSVKSNIGHTDAAAGIAGLIKTVLVLQHGIIPQNLHFATPNPHIPWDQLPVRVAAEATPWPPGDRPRIAGVSAFGMSGTNAHVILEEAPRAADPAGREAPMRKVQLLVLSGRTDAAARGAAQRLAAHLRAHPE
ncbi:type I polyketide synthase, partial [Serratia ficaria]|uniref:type I polyketide synthase n=1 Tax=Serratia ficaria TaxID=61651 RepID=UPI0021C8EA0F